MGPTVRELRSEIEPDQGLSESSFPGQWFAVTVRPQHEVAVRSGLEAKELSTYLPTYRTTQRWSDRLKRIDRPLFPGYVFCQFEFGDRVRVLRTPGVRSIVSFGNQMIPVHRNDLEQIERMLESPYPLEPWPYLQVGERIKIAGGPLAGITGFFERRESGGRFVVSIEMLQRSIAVHLEAEDLSPISHGPVFVAQ
jgi:transcription antitermination factor NusG